MVQAMAHDPAFHVWVLTKLESITLSRVTSREQLLPHRLVRIIGSCHQYAMAKAAEKPDDVTEAEKRSMFLFHFMLAPINSSPSFLDKQVREAVNSRLDVFQFTTELHHMRALLSEPRQAALSAWSLAYQRMLVADELQVRAHFNPQSQRAANPSASGVNSAQPSRNPDRAQVSEGTAAREEKQAGPDPGQKSVYSPYSYPRDDLIDRVADRKANRQEVTEFKRKLGCSTEFHQKVEDRIGIYKSRSEEAKRKKLMAVLNAVKGNQSSCNWSAASAPAKGKWEQISNGPGSSSDKPHSRATEPHWEVKLASQHHKAARQVRKQCKAIERTGKVISLLDASPEVQEGIRNMHFLAKKGIDLQIRHFFPSIGTGALGHRATDAIQALQALHFEHGRLAELQMLAAVSGEGVFESTEELVEMITRDMGEVMITSFARPSQQETR